MEFLNLRQKLVRQAVKIPSKGNDLRKASASTDSSQGEDSERVKEAVGYRDAPNLESEYLSTLFKFVAFGFLIRI